MPRAAIVTDAGNKAYGVLCSDGKRRNARLYREHFLTDSTNTTASVKVQGETVLGFISSPPWRDDFFFFAFQHGRNANLLPHIRAEKYQELFPMVYSVIQFMPPYMPTEDNPPIFTNRKDAERYAAEEKRRYLEQSEEDAIRCEGSAREGRIYMHDASREHDLGWCIEICEIDLNLEDPEERDAIMEEL